MSIIINIGCTVQHCSGVGNEGSTCLLQVNTTDTSYIINQTAEGRCQPHSFTVTARNEAGDSNSTSIQESIPICEGYRGA